MRGGVERRQAKTRAIVRALAASSIALVYVVTLGLPMLHYVLERHEVCAEHGELTHATSGPRAPAVTHDVATLDAHDLSAHGHCDVPQASDAIVVAAHRPLVLDVVQDAVGACALDETSPRVVRALDFAPKTSPPARAALG